MLRLLSDFWALGQAIRQACQFSAPETTYHGFVSVLGLNKSDLFSCISLVSVCSSLWCFFQPFQTRIYVSSEGVGFLKDNWASEDFLQRLQVLLEYSVPSSSDIKTCESVTLSIPYGFNIWHICMFLYFQDLKPVM